MWKIFGTLLQAIMPIVDKNQRRNRRTCSRGIFFYQRREVITAQVEMLGPLTQHI